MNENLKVSPRTGHAVIAAIASELRAHYEAQIAISPVPPHLSALLKAIPFGEKQTRERIP
jgi:hypothetical protein